MTTYKVTKRSDEKGEYFTDLMKAMSNKEFMKKIRRDGHLYHIYGMTPNQETWFKLD